MIQSLRQIKARIRSIENTRKLARAMEMISASKLKRSSRLLETSSAYSSRIESLLVNILSSAEGVVSPFLKAGTDKQAIGLCILTSDTGLCGNYNHSLIRAAENFLSRYPASKVRLVTLGRKGFTYFKKKGFPIARSYIGFNGRYSDDLCRRLLGDLTQMFLKAEAGEVYVAYMQSETASRQKAVIEKLLEIGYDKKEQKEYIFDSGRQRMLDELIPVYLCNKVTTLVLKAFTAEHQARAIAMGEATKNATDLLEGLVLLRNKVRQGNITREIIEVISSAEALKG